MIKITQAEFAEYQKLKNLDDNVQKKIKSYQDWDRNLSQTASTEDTDRIAIANKIYRLLELYK